MTMQATDYRPLTAEWNNPLPDFEISLLTDGVGYRGIRLEVDGAWYVRLLDKTSEATLVYSYTEHGEHGSLIETWAYPSEDGETPRAGAPCERFLLIIGPNARVLSQGEIAPERIGISTISEL